MQEMMLFEEAVLDRQTKATGTRDPTARTRRFGGDQEAVRKPAQKQLAQRLREAGHFAARLREIPQNQGAHVRI